jgi:hypothetical protein
MYFTISNLSLPLSVTHHVLSFVAKLHSGSPSITTSDLPRLAHAKAYLNLRVELRLINVSEKSTFLNIDANRDAR